MGSKKPQPVEHGESAPPPPKKTEASPELTKALKAIAGLKSPPPEKPEADRDWQAVAANRGEQIGILKDELAKANRENAELRREVAQLRAKSGHVEQELSVMRSRGGDSGCVIDNFEYAGDIERLRIENKKLKDAIADAGFSVMQTSGRWSIHDVSQKGLADEAESLEVATRNVDLEAEIASLRDVLERAPIGGLCAEVYICEGDEYTPEQQRVADWLRDRREALGKD